MDFAEIMWYNVRLMPDKVLEVKRRWYLPSFLKKLRQGRCLTPTPAPSQWLVKCSLTSSPPCLAWWVGICLLRACLSWLNNGGYFSMRKINDNTETGDVTERRKKTPWQQRVPLPWTYTFDCRWIELSMVTIHGYKRTILRARDEWQDFSMARHAHL